MKRLYQVLVLTIIAGLRMATPAVAQDQPVQSGPFTLQQCIDYALQNATAAKNATLDEEIAAARVKETVGIGLPQINGTATITHNTKLQRFFTAYSPQGGLIDVGKNPGLNNGDVLAAPNVFQLKSSGDVSLSVNQIIFNGSYIVGLQASKAYKDLSYRANIQTKEQIIQQVTKAYYGVLINRERSQLFTSNIARVDTLLRNTRALNQNGFAEGIDVDRIRVTLNNLTTERDKFENLNLLSIEMLKFQMNYPMSESIEIAGTINEIEIDTALLNNEGWDYKNRPDYKVLEANKRLQELNIKNLRANSLPSLSAFANLGMATQSSDVKSLFQTNTDISSASDTVRAIFGADKWYDYSMIGVRLNVPIFTGLQNTRKVQQQRLELQKINNNVTMMKSSIDLETRQASLTFDNALKTLSAQKENMELASNVARITKIKYQQGVGSNLEVVDAEDSLRQAQTNYYNALYDVVISKVDLDKAYGKIVIPPTQTK